MNRKGKALVGMALALMLALTPLMALAEAGKTHVTMWGWADDWRRAFEDYLSETGANVEFEYISVAGTDYLQKLQTAAAAGTRMPDVAAMEMGWRGKAISLGIFENLEAEPYNLNREDMMDFLLPLCTDESGVVRGVEIQPAPGGLAYRRELCKQYFGTDDAAELEKMLSSWDDFITLGQQVLEKSEGKVRMFASIDDVASIMVAQNAAPYVKEGKSNLDAALLNAFEKTKQMLDLGIVDTLGNMTPAWYASLASDQYIFYPCPSWYPFYVIEPNDAEGQGKWGIMMPPETAYNMGGTLFGIPTMAESAESKQAAWDFIHWFTLSEPGAVWIRDNWDSPSSYKPIYSKPEFFEGRVNPFFGMNLSEVYLRIAPNVTARQISAYDNIITADLALGYRALEAGSSAADAVSEVEFSLLEQAPELAE